MESYNIKFSDKGAFCILEVFVHDLSFKMNWEDASKACHNLDGNWRLPSVTELQKMFDQLHCKGLGNFKTDAPYWSSEEEDDFAWPFDFSLRPCFSDGKGDLFYVRPVRILHC